MILDATPAGLSANSYLTVGAADSLAGADLGSAAAAWLAAVTAQKEAALVRATREVNAYLRSSGIARYAAAQSLLYPRAVDTAPGTQVLGSSVANPTVLTTAAPHGFTSGQSVTIVSHLGSVPSLSGPYIITVTGPVTFTVPVAVTVPGFGGRVVNAALTSVPIIPGAIASATFAQAKYLNANADVLDAAATRKGRGLTSASEPNISYSNPERSSDEPHLCDEALGYLQGIFARGATVRSVVVGTPYTYPVLGDPGLGVLP